MILCKIFTLIYFSLAINRAIKNFTCLGLLLSMVSSLNYVFNFIHFFLTQYCVGELICIYINCLGSN